MHKFLNGREHTPNDCALFCLTGSLALPENSTVGLFIKLPLGVEL